MKNELNDYPKSYHVTSVPDLNRTTNTSTPPQVDQVPAAEPVGDVTGRVYIRGRLQHVITPNR
jgi:hypothetical protein